MGQSSLNPYVLYALDVQRAISQARQAELTETQVYIGLNDAETKKQEHETDRYVSVLKKVCVDHGVPFSFDIVNGGYIHDDGEYTEEKTIVLTFINVPQGTVDDIARDLCVFFHQESVLITDDRVRVRTIRESLAE